MFCCVVTNGVSWRSLRVPGQVDKPMLTAKASRGTFCFHKFASDVRFDDLPVGQITDLSVQPLWQKIQPNRFLIFRIALDGTVDSGLAIRSRRRLTIKEAAALRPRTRYRAPVPG
jgi:hypothetical protein